MAKIPRLMLAAPASGGGKTTVTCGLLRALQRRGKTPVAFKCGPDYIDPMFHRSVLGAPTGNLDLFFTEAEVVRGLLAQGAKCGDISVIEGVMGFYDGLSSASDEASSWQLAKETGTPVVLVLDVKGSALSVAAVAKGFAQFRADSGIKALLLNRCSEGLFAQLVPAIERETDLPVVGYLPKNEDWALESRHLGLVTAAEIEDLQQKMDSLAAQMEKSVDLDAILSLVQSAPELDAVPPALPMEREKTAASVKIAVAKDAAFCFYYEENLQLLRDLGAELCLFSPLEDAALPEGCGALYLGGGYPELYTKNLSENAPMREAVRGAVAGGMPTFAECGGFLYLLESLTGEDGAACPMAGALPGSAANTGRLQRFGYASFTAQKDNLLCRAGEAIRGHEFHYLDSDNNGADFTAAKPTGNRQWPCVHATGTLFAGFPHLYFWANPRFAARFVQAARLFAGTGKE